MAVKSWVQGYTTGGTSPYIRIVRVSDGKNWDGSDWASGETLLAMNEEFPGFWLYEVTAVWPDDTLRVAVYADNFSNAALLRADTVRVVGDALAEGATLGYLTAKNATRDLMAALSALKSDVADLRARVVALNARLPTATQMRG